MTSFKHVKYFCFRFCHDESVKGHTIDRGLVTEVECGVCGLRQGVARGCVRCQAESGSRGSVTNNTCQLHILGFMA